MAPAPDVAFSDGRFVFRGRIIGAIPAHIAEREFRVAGERPILHGAERVISRAQWEAGAW